MKITKSQLKKLLIEEIENNQELINSINALAGSIEDLDVSIDYLTSAVTGDDPYTTNMLQKGFGRLAKPSKSDAGLSEGHGGEGSMARGQLGRTVEMAAMIQEMINDDSDLEEWVESKITKAHDYLSTVLNYMRGNDLSEILSSAADVGDYVTDFRTSKAPQFQGKSKKKRTQMAIAAALDAEDENKKKKRGKK